MSDFLNKAKDFAEGLKDKVEDLVHTVEDKLPGHSVGDAKDAAAGKAGEAADKLKDAAEEATS